MAASLFFYAWGAPKFVFILLGSSVLDYFLCLKIANLENKRQKKLLLTTSVVVNLGLLAYFKYANFAVENISHLISSFGFSELSWEKVVLPIGISFFTFQKMSYVFDVYRKVKKPLTNFFDLLLFIVLFPQLIAGPIVRFQDIADEIRGRVYNGTHDDRLLGLFRFIVGLAKKVLIANVLGAEAAKVFGTASYDLSAGTAWYGAICYTFQIYFDFSGYSDMAIGIGRMLGFTFPENFNNPYISRSISEFWQRWHMTLGTWMRDYLYIPLGGNRVTKGRLYFNLWFVFLVSGIWHGASWNFLIWGAYHGLFLVLERLFLKRWYDYIGGTLNIAITFFITVFGWVIFRIDDLQFLRKFIEIMFLGDWSLSLIPGSVKVCLLLAFVISFLPAIPSLEVRLAGVYETLKTKRRTLSVFMLSVVLLFVSVCVVVSSGFNPFIYFKF